MKRFILKPIERHYANNGQHLEQMFRYTVSGKIERADRRPATECADCNGYQIKSARATICKGRDLIGALNRDKANAYAYVAKNGTAYLMSRAEYIEFVNEFGTLTTDSPKNGGSEKIRLRYETETMLKWLNDRAGR